jgi:uncharacterized protein YbjT (DUF2867 family)
VTAIPDVVAALLGREPRRVPATTFFRGLPDGSEGDGTFPVTLRAGGNRTAQEKEDAMLVTVMGATGKTGKAVSEGLLAAGVQVRALGRSAEKLAPLVRAGAQPVVGDVNRPADLTAAFRGADAVYALVPPSLAAPDVLGHYDQVNGAIATALTESGVKRVVYLSSIGADQPSGTGPVAGLYRGEAKLKSLPGLDLLLLRPGYFYENHLGSIGLIKSQGINGSATAPDVPVVQIASRDIGELAARALAAKDFSGVTVRELFGPRDLTMAEVTPILGSKIGKPELKYVQFPDDGVLAALKGAGFSESVARSFVEMSHALNTGWMVARQKRTPGNTGSTTIESFAEAWAKAYLSS